MPAFPSRFRAHHRIAPLEGGGLFAGLWEGAPCVFLKASWPKAEVEAAAAAHQAIESPHVAPVLASDATEGWVAFACDAAVDLDLLLDAALANGVKIPYPAAVAFNDGLLDALEAAHDAGRYAGSLAWRNFLVGPSGDWWLFAFDGNPYLAGTVTAAGFSMAPEVALGGEPTPAADAYAQYAILRSLLPCMALYEGFDVAIRGEVGGKVIHALQALSAAVLAKPVGPRVNDIPSLRACWRSLRAADPTMPEGDGEVLRKAFADLADRARGPEEGEEAEVAPVSSVPITLKVDGRRLGRGDAWIDLSERRVLWRVWSALVAAREGEGSLSVERILEEAWSGERVSHESGRARVYVAISTLRKLGLDDVIERDEHGYRLSSRLHFA